MSHVSAFSLCGSDPGAGGLIDIPLYQGQEGQEPTKIPFGVCLNISTTFRQQGVLSDDPVAQAYIGVSAVLLQAYVYSR